MGRGVAGALTSSEGQEVVSRARHCWVMRRLPSVLPGGALALFPGQEH